MLLYYIFHWLITNVEIHFGGFHTLSEHCQLSECVWSDWSIKEGSCCERRCERTKTNSKLPKHGGKSCEEVAACNGHDCWKGQTENKTCGKYKWTKLLAIECSRIKDIPLCKVISFWF